jgi:hypothetical protein
MYASKETVKKIYDSFIKNENDGVLYPLDVQLTQV